MNRTKLFYFCTLILAVCISFFACNKINDLDEVELGENDAEYAIPLFNSSLSFNDILGNFDEDTFITVEDDGLIKLNYKGNLLQASSEDIFNLLGTALPIIMTDTVVTASYAVPGSIEIDYIALQGGTIVVNFESQHTQDVDVKLSIPGLKDENGDEFEKTWNLEYDGTPPAVIQIWGLDGYSITPDDNSFTVRYEAIKADGNRDTLSNVVIALANIEYSYVEGYLGNDIYRVGQDTIEIDFFENWTRGDIYFEDPLMKINVFNSFGFPIDAKIYSVDVINVNGEILPLQSQFIEDGIEINYPTFNEVGEVKTTIFDFNKNNSNIDEILGSEPVAVRYNMDGEPNPEETSSVRGFMTDSSAMQVQVEVELPIYGSANDFVVRDTFDINLVEYNDVKYAEFKLISENETALDVAMQVYFTDDQSVVLDSLLTPMQSIIEAAPVDVEGNVTETNEKTILIPYTAERFGKIINAEKAIVLANFSTYDNGSISVRVLSDEQVRLRMGVKFGL